MIENPLVTKLNAISLNTPTVRIMEFCGGHTHALVNSGVLSILPSNIKMVHGPGCPVCVLPAHHLQAMIDLLELEKNITVATYGDVMRIPTLKGDSLLKAKGRGQSVRMIYSPLEIIQWAREKPNQEFLFLAIGFETTAPATALLLKRLKTENILNVSILCLHVLTPPSISAVMDDLSMAERPQGLIGPGHVSLVTGIALYEKLATTYQIPIVISGFESEDLIESLFILQNMLRNKEVGVRNQYTRALRPLGNLVAQKLLDETFNIREQFTWRGLGVLPNSAFGIRPEWDIWNAEKKYELKYRDVAEHPHCKCGSILKGKNTPRDCKLFMKACTPIQPLGACMVSSEGACHAYYQLGEHQ